MARGSAPTKTRLTGQVISLSPEQRAKFKARREELELKQSEVANRIGVTAATISNIESGRSKQVRRVVYAKLHRALFGTGGVADPDGRDEIYRQIVEGASDLDEQQLRAVRTIIESLKNSR